MATFRSFTGYLNTDLFGSENPGTTGDFNTDLGAATELNIVLTDGDTDLVIEGDSTTASTSTETSEDPENDQIAFIEDASGTVLVDGVEFYLETSFTFTVAGDPNPGTVYTGYTFETNGAPDVDFTILPPDVPVGTASIQSRDFSPDPDEVPYADLASGDEIISEDSPSSLDLSGDDIIIAGTGDDTVSGGGGNDDISGGAGDDTIFGDSSTESNTTDPFNIQYFELTGTISTLADAGFDAVGDNSGVPTEELEGDDLGVNAISLANGGDGETYAVRFETTLNVTTDGTYTFTTTSDDGSQLFIDGILVVDNDGLHGTATETGSTTLSPGEHSVVIVFFENTGGDNLSATISGPDTGDSAIDITTADIVGPDAITGIAGDDTIDGGDGNDTVFGDAGDDTITVGVGDTATGNADADTFTLDFDQTSSDGSTTITIDGSTTEDLGIDDDTLDLTGFTFN